MDFKLTGPLNADTGTTKCMLDFFFQNQLYQLGIKCMAVSIVGRLILHLKKSWSFSKKVHLI